MYLVYILTKYIWFLSYIYIFLITKRARARLSYIFYNPDFILYLKPTIMIGYSIPFISSTLSQHLFYLYLNLSSSHNTNFSLSNFIHPNGCTIDTFIKPNLCTDLYFELNLPMFKYRLLNLDRTV
jgi:hypothetical protein